MKSSIIVEGWGVGVSCGVSRFPGGQRSAGYRPPGWPERCRPLVIDSAPPVSGLTEMGKDRTGRGVFAIAITPYLHKYNLGHGVYLLLAKLLFVRYHMVFFIFNSVLNTQAMCKTWI